MSFNTSYPTTTKPITNHKNKNPKNQATDHISNQGSHHIVHQANHHQSADTTLYQLHQCNWERDFLTTAVPNPQQGANAPLVGLTVGDVVTRSEDGTLSVQKQTVLVDEDGSKYGISYKLSEDGKRLVGVNYDPVSEKTPVPLS